MTGYYFYDYNKKNDSTGAWWGMFGCWTAAGIYCLCLLCCFRNLRVSIAIIETAADWFADTKRILFVPVGFLSIFILVFAAWSTGTVMVYSITEEPITPKDPGSGS